MRRFKIVFSFLMFILACGALLAVTPAANASATLNSNEAIVLSSSEPIANLVVFSTDSLYVARGNPPILRQVPADFALLALKPAAVDATRTTSPVVFCGAANSPYVADDVAIISPYLVTGSAMSTPDMANAGCTRLKMPLLKAFSAKEENLYAVTWSPTMRWITLKTPNPAAFSHTVV